MQIEKADFFFTHYAGCLPEDPRTCLQTQDMINHYIDSGLKDKLPEIYEANSKDGFMCPDNIPYKIWEEGNLIKPNHFYLHKELTLKEPSPMLDPDTGKMITYSPYREMKERYTLDDLLLYANKMLRRTLAIKDVRTDYGALKHLLGKYSPLSKEGINSLDMVLFLISYHKGESIELINLSNDEEEVLKTVRAYDQKLKSMDRHKVVWRGSICKDT